MSIFLGVVMDPISTINYKKDTDWHEEVLKLTDGAGVDHVLETGLLHRLLHRPLGREVRHRVLRALVEPFRLQGIKYQKERYLTDSRESIFKPENQWNAHDRWINHRWANVTENDDFSE